MIRPATVTDVPRIVEMVGHFIGSTPYGRVLQFMPSAVAELAEMILEHGIILLAERDGEVVGMLGALPMVDPVSRQPMVDELVWWVEPAHRSGMTGPRLLRALEEWARQKRLSLCKMVAPVGTNVGEFYVRSGYTPIETSYLKRL
jgi:GNAT superfamily N-acetyltransferase